MQNHTSQCRQVEITSVSLKLYFPEIAYLQTINWGISGNEMKPLKSNMLLDLLPIQYSKGIVPQGLRFRFYIFLIG